MKIPMMMMMMMMTSRLSLCIAVGDDQHPLPTGRAVHPAELPPTPTAPRGGSIPTAGRRAASAAGARRARLRSQGGAPIRGACSSCCFTPTTTMVGWAHSPHILMLSTHSSIHPSVGCSHSEGLHGECCRAQRSSVGEAEHRLQLGKPISDEPLSSSASRGHSDHRAPSTLSLPGCHEQL